jgi:hypothetical protein
MRQRPRPRCGPADTGEHPWALDLPARLTDIGMHVRIGRSANGSAEARRVHGFGAAPGSLRRTP